MPITLNGDTGIQTPMYNGTITANAVTPSVNMKNRIINGAMTIDQRNAGASVTPTTSVYTLDRWFTEVSQSSKFSIQQNAGSVTPPAGFRNYLGVTSLAATSVGANDYFVVEQRIEGFNTADLNWGTANAQTVTLSFWVRSSLTGTFGGVVGNSAGTRSYPFTYTISTANTWEQKSVTVAGDTSGTWLTTNGAGLILYFGLGVGSTYSGTAGAWNSDLDFSATGATSVVGTNGATFYITGVQLEVGSTATSFDYLPYGTELALCQRYFYRMINGDSQAISTGGYFSNSDIRMVIPFPVTMRISPAIVSSSGTGYFRIQSSGGGDDVFSELLDGGPKSPTAAMLYQNSNISGTAGQVGFVYSNNASASLAFNSEL
jgi:hypothetical protein